MRRQFLCFWMIAAAAVVAAGEAHASIDPIEPNDWLAEPTWNKSIVPVPLVTPPPRREQQPEPIPLPPAAFAVAGPALITFILARLSAQRRQRHPRRLRG